MKKKGEAMCFVTAVLSTQVSARPVQSLALDKMQPKSSRIGDVQTSTLSKSLQPSLQLHVPSCAVQAAAVHLQRSGLTKYGQAVTQMSAYCEADRMFMNCSMQHDNRSSRYGCV